MSNSPVQILWCDIELKSGRRFVFPIVLNVFRELLDCAADLTALAGAAMPKSSSLSSKVRGAGEITRLLMQLTASLTKDRPYHLIDVAADELKFKVKVK